jgi:hypothetical protein
MSFGATGKQTMCKFGSMTKLATKFDQLQMTAKVGLSSDFHMCSYSHLSASDSDRLKQLLQLIK